MTLFELAAENGDRRFRIGRSKVIWECASIVSNDSVRVSRVTKQGGKPFMLGLFYRSRYAHSNCLVSLVD